MIASRESDEDLLIEDDYCVAVADPVPRARGHYLVVPKHHFERLDVIGEDNAELIGRVVLGAMALGRKTGLDKAAYHIVINCGEQLGHRVNHLHVHVMGGA